MDNDLGARIFGARKRLGESQLAFAKRLQVAQPTVSHLENGSLPKLPLYARLVPLLEEIERGQHDKQEVAS